MMRRARRRKIQWRRVAQFEPVRVDGPPIAQEEATDRPSGRALLEPGTRVALVRERKNERDPHAVIVASLDEQPLGYLPADVADWVAPLMDTGRMAFDGRIYAVCPAESGPPARAAGFYVTLTQFELAPVEHFSLTLAARALVRLPLQSANWCFGHVAAVFHTFSPPSSQSPERYATDDRSGS
jgi:HIRAN domain